MHRSFAQCIYLAYGFRPQLITSGPQSEYAAHLEWTLVEQELFCGHVHIHIHIYTHVYTQTSSGSGFSRIKGIGPNEQDFATDNICLKQYIMVSYQRPCGQEQPQTLRRATEVTSGSQ